MSTNEIDRPYDKDGHFEKILADVNAALTPLEARYVAQYNRPHYPVVFVAGTQRSGTTLLMQLMISCFRLGYVSNLMARFWRAPYVGALLVRELQRKKLPTSPDFTSALGATYGYDGPHEFGYFWQHWFPYNKTHQTSDEDLSNMDADRFRRELAAIEAAFDMPLVFKNPIVFSLNMQALADLIPTAMFLVCHRQPLYVAQSTLLSRLEFLGNKDAWFSVKPPEYIWLKEQPYPEQIAGQIFYTERRIRESLESIDSRRWLVVEYDDLCTQTQEEMERIHGWISAAGKDLERTEYRPTSFENTNVQRLDDMEFERLRAACSRFWATCGDRFHV